MFQACEQKQWQFAINDITQYQKSEPKDSGILFGCVAQGKCIYTLEYLVVSHLSECVVVIRVVNHMMSGKSTISLNKNSYVPHPE